MSEGLHLRTRSGHEPYLRALRAMGPVARLKRAFELSEFTRALFREGLRKRFPSMSEADRHRLYLDRMAKCHNRNY